MHASDDNQFPLAKAKRTTYSRRAVSKRDFALPKPYRRQLFSEEPDRLTRLQVSLLAFAGLLVTTLVGVLALLAHETERSPDGKVIVAAARLEDIEPGPTPLAAFPAKRPAPEHSLPPALRQGTRLVALPAPAGKPSERMERKPALKLTTARVATAPVALTARGRVLAALPVRSKKVKVARKAVPAAVPVPVPAVDPDVVLITAILMLTPAPAPVVAPAVALELPGRGGAVCLSEVAKQLTCSDLPKMKP